jgi:hypothetical protein
VDRQGEAGYDVARPRSAWQLIGATVDVYWRYPFLFLTLAGAVVVPYELILLAATGNGPYAQRHDGFIVAQIVSLVSLGVVGPLVSALHVHAVRDIGDGKTPRVGDVARRSLAVLPVAALAVTISFIGTMLGVIALIVPGVLLYLRWAVVAQAAALEHAGWQAALRRSTELTDDRYRHVFALVFCVVLISFAVSFGARAAFGTEHTTVPTFLIGTALEVLVWSFGALATALLYFDLKARLENQVVELGGDARIRSSSSVDPGNYTDEDRPPGWYVIPEKPWRMRYWAADGKPGWSKRTAKTPKATLAEWKDLRWVREKT